MIFYDKREISMSYLKTLIRINFTALKNYSKVKKSVPKLSRYLI